MAEISIKKQVIKKFKSFFKIFFPSEKNDPETTLPSSTEVSSSIKRQDSFPSTSISEGTTAQNVRSSQYKVTLNPTPLRYSLSELLSLEEYEKAVELLKGEPKQIKLLLFEACYSNDLQLLTTVLDRSKLFKYAADPASKNPSGKTPLHIACSEGYIDLCQILLSYLPSPDLLDADLKSPLHYSCISNQLQITSLLLSSGSNPNIQDAFGNTSLHYAYIAGDQALVDLLLCHLADPTILNNESKTPQQLGPEATSITSSTSEDFYTVSFPYTRAYSKVISDINKYIIKPFAQLQLQPSDFQPLRFLGRGNFGEVYLVRFKKTEEEFAMKILGKNRIIAEKLVNYAVTERNVMSTVRHPFVVSLRYAFQTTSKLYLIEDYCPGGTLKGIINKKRKLDEALAKLYCSEIVLGLEELHRNGVIYRDLKPENVAICADGHIKLIDFGLSKDHFVDCGETYSFCGSISYLAPEILKRTGHGKAVDWYLLGIVLFEMLTGRVPFVEINSEKMLKKILTSRVEFPSYLSENCRDLLEKLLDKDPDLRIGSKCGSADIKSHRFFEDIDWEVVLAKGLGLPIPEPKKVVLEAIPQEEILDTCLQSFPNIQGWTFIHTD